MSITEAILKKVSALSPEKQEDVLEFVDALTKKTNTKMAEPYSALRAVAELEFDGPTDASRRFHEYLYGDNAR
ncbi:MAG TPA: hypothetical protein VGN23_01935 [Verrucomicrobiae bacterium]|jgi:hypothetical protein